MTARVLFFVVLLVGSVSAQFNRESTIRRIRVRVVSASGGGCDASTRITLMGRGGPAGAGSPDSDCEVEFYNIPVGTYHLTVSALNIITFETGSMAIDAAGPTEVEVKIAPPGSSVAAGTQPASPLVGVAELNIPSSARKEFDKANQLVGKQDYAKAIQRLNKAITIYPAYAGAYNNLAAVYDRLGDGAQEREALRKALSINDRFAPAYVNLGRMKLKAGNFPEAEDALNKASSLDPNDGTTMVLLTYAEFMDQHLDEAIATSRRAHSLAQAPHAFVHHIAARAFELKGDGANAIAELELFLKEDPTGPQAEFARKELAGLETARR